MGTDSKSTSQNEWCTVDEGYTSAPKERERPCSTYQGVATEYE